MTLFCMKTSCYRQNTHQKYDLGHVVLDFCRTLQIGVKAEYSGLEGVCLWERAAQLAEQINQFASLSGNEVRWRCSMATKA